MSGFLLYDTCLIFLQSLVDMMASAGGDLAIRQLHVDGGAAANDLMLQTLANVTPCGVQRFTVLETTGLGAAMAAMLGVGILESLEDVRGRLRPDRLFEPAVDFSEVQRELWKRRWNLALDAVVQFAEES